MKNSKKKIGKKKLSAKPARKIWNPGPEPACYECWSYRHFYKRNAPKCPVCRGEVPARILPDKTRFGINAKQSTRQRVVSEKTRAAKEARTGSRIG